MLCWDFGWTFFFFLFFCQALCYPLLGKATSATEGKALWMKMQSRNCHTDTNKISRESCRYFNTPIPTSTNSKNSLYLKKKKKKNARVALLPTRHFRDIGSDDKFQAPYSFIPTFRAHHDLYFPQNLHLFPPTNNQCAIMGLQWDNPGTKGAFTCRLMKLDVVSEDVLPSERLKRLLRLGNFRGSCEEERDAHGWRDKKGNG